MPLLRSALPGTSRPFANEVADRYRNDVFGRRGTPHREQWLVEGVVAAVDFPGRRGHYERLSFGRDLVRLSRVMSANAIA